MFEVGNYIVYGNSGVCKVEAIGPMDVAGNSKNRLYYTLGPVYSKGSKIFTPTDNNKVIMRPIISKEEALLLIDNITHIETLIVEDEKRSEEVYKEALRSCDCREWIKIIKTLYIRKQSRIAEGKKVIISDEKYLKRVEDDLYGELAISLDMEKDKVKEFIEIRVELMNTEK